MNRRDFLLASGAAAAWSGFHRTFAAEHPPAQIMAVTGAIRSDELGVTLPHEHVMVDFVGAEQVSHDRYDADEVFEVVLPQLQQLRRLGCATLVECTPAYIGRDPALLKRLSEASGLKILTNTGYYAARQGSFLPAEVARLSADDLSRIWLAEWNDGIAETGIRPGFIKIGVDAGPLTEAGRKIVRAAGRTHLKSGLTIAGHTGDGKAAMEQIDILRDEGVSPSAWIWVHAQNERNSELHIRAAKAGAWVEFDGIRPDSVERHVSLVQTMRRHELLGRVLISHDAGWYSVGEPRGGSFRSFDTLFTQFLPALKEAGFSDAELHNLTVDNPASALTIRARAE